MSTKTNHSISVKHIEKSRINEIDFNNLIFGNDFTDYMFECDFKNGSWNNPTIKPFGNLSISPVAKVFHY